MIAKLRWWVASMIMTRQQLELVVDALEQHEMAMQMQAILKHCEFQEWSGPIQ